MKDGPKEKSNKLLILAGILLLGLVNGALWLYSSKLHLPASLRFAAASPAAGVPFENVTLDPLIVNLGGGQGYLKIAMTLSLSGGERPQQRSSGAPDLAGSALVRDTILQALSSQNADALLTAEGKTALKKTLKAALRAKVPGLALDRIYFTEFLVER